MGFQFVSRNCLVAQYTETRENSSYNENHCAASRQENSEYEYIQWDRPVLGGEVWRPKSSWGRPFFSCCLHSPSDNDYVSRESLACRLPSRVPPLLRHTRQPSPQRFPDLEKSSCLNYKRRWIIPSMNAFTSFRVYTNGNLNLVPITYPANVFFVYWWSRKIGRECFVCRTGTYTGPLPMMDRRPLENDWNNLHWYALSDNLITFVIYFNWDW